MNIGPLLAVAIIGALISIGATVMLDSRKRSSPIAIAGGIVAAAAGVGIVMLLVRDAWWWGS